MLLQGAVDVHECSAKLVRVRLGIGEKRASAPQKVVWIAPHITSPTYQRQRIGGAPTLLLWAADLPPHGIADLPRPIDDDHQRAAIDGTDAARAGIGAGAQANLAGLRTT